MKKLLFFISIIALLSSCKKEPLPELPPDTTPYYSISGILNGDSLSLNVGQEGIEIAQGTSMYNGVESYFGLISSASQDIEIKFEFTRPQKPLTAMGQSVFDYTALGFLVDQDGCVDLGFGSNQMQQNYLEIKYEQSDFEPGTTINFKEYGKHDVKLRFSNYSQQVFIIPVKYGFKDNQLNAEFVAIPSADTITLGPYDQTGFHEWFVDGSLVSHTPVFSSTFDIGIHTVRHTICDEFGNKSSHTTLMRVSDYVLDWKMDLTCCSPTVVNNYGKVIVQVTKAGEVYTSKTTTINNSNVFSASNLELVSKQQGQVPTWAVFDFYFDATLVNQTNTDSLSLDGMMGTFNIGL